MLDDDAESGPTDLLEMRREAARAQLIRVAGGQQALPRNWRPTLVVLVLALVLAAAGVGYSVISSNAGVTNRAFVECRMSLDPGEHGSMMAPATPGYSGVPGPAQEISDAVAACRTGWEIGLYPNNIHPKPLFDEQGHITGLPAVPPVRVKAPSLVACVAKDGHAVVIPSDDPHDCITAGLSMIVAPSTTTT